MPPASSLRLCFPMCIAKAKLGLLGRETKLTPIFAIIWPLSEVAVYCKIISKYKRTGNEYLFPAKVRANTPYVTLRLL